MTRFTPWSSRTSRSMLSIMSWDLRMSSRASTSTWTVAKVGPGRRSGRPCRAGEHALVPQDVPGEELLHLLRRRLAQELVHRVAQDPDRGPEDEPGHHNAHVAVERKVDQGAYDRGEEHRGPWPARPRGCRPRSRAWRRSRSACQRRVVAVHPKLHRDGGGQHPDREPGEGDFLRLEDLPHAVAQELHPQQQHDEGHGERGDVLHARMARRDGPRPRACRRA